MNESRRLQAVTRRHFFQTAGFGLGGAALASLMQERLFAHAASQVVPKMAPRAKQVIFLFMAGAPSQLDLFDNKPALRKYDGQDIPAEIVKGERFAFIKGTPKLLGSPYDFRRCSCCSSCSNGQQP